jgi:hypothetical protein
MITVSGTRPDIDRSRATWMLTMMIYLDMKGSRLGSSGAYLA